MKNPKTKGGPYRSRNSMVLGVCAGVAEHFGISPFWIRLAAVAALILTTFWPTLILYFIAAMIMKPQPAQPISSNQEEDFYDAYVKSPNYTIHNIHEKFMNLDRRIQRMEDTVTARGYEWDRKFNA